MFAQAHYPSEPLKPEELDDYLEKGWFRLGQSVFTCAYLQLDDEVYRTFWLRVVLNEFIVVKTLKNLLKLNAKFRIDIRNAIVTPEKEALYLAYKSGIAFEHSESLSSLLFHHQSDTNVFHTLEINIYDEDRLIAVGIFDTGLSTAAGIISFYDPAYKKYSLGKYLIYQKILYCKSLGMEYFYLGYFAPGCKAFDYKLDIGKEALQYLDLCSERWMDMLSWHAFPTSMEENKQKLMELQDHLSFLNMESHLTFYPYFQANLVRELQGFELFDYVHFIYFHAFNPNGINPILVYDFRDGKYHLLHCVSIGTPEESKDHVHLLPAHLLQIKEIIYSSKSSKDMADMMLRVFILLKRKSG